MTSEDSQNRSNQDEPDAFVRADGEKVPISDFSIDNAGVDGDVERGLWVSNKTVEFSFEVELKAQDEQIEMQVDDPRELAKRTGKTVLMDDGKLVGLYDLEMNFGGNDE